MHAALGLVTMTRARGKSQNPLKKWWNSKSNQHFQAYTIMTLFSLAVALFCFLFLFFMDGVSRLEGDGNEDLIPLIWLGLLGGTIALFFTAPEFLYFLGKKQLLDEILYLDSRAEVLRRRREAEVAADLLGPTYQARLKGLYQSLGISVGKKYKMDALPPKGGAPATVDKSSEEE